MRHKPFGHLRPWLLRDQLNVACAGDSCSSSNDRCVISNHEDEYETNQQQPVHQWRNALSLSQSVLSTVPATDLKQCGGSRRIMYFNVVVDVDVDVDDDDDGGDDDDDDDDDDGDDDDDDDDDDCGDGVGDVDGVDDDGDDDDSK